MRRLTDTTPEADRVFTAAYRQMPLARKWQLLGETFRTARLLHAAGVRLRRPAASAEDIHNAWLTVQFGRDLGTTGDKVAMEPTNTQNLLVVREVISAFARLDIPCALGGSMASSLYGIARYTQDADLTVESFAGKEGLLAASFGPDYYVSLPAIQQAVRECSSFNLINTVQGFKVDVFLRKDQPFDRTAMARRRYVTLPDHLEQPLAVYTAEDVILFKLRWYRLGNEAASQQWNDVVNVLKVQAGDLDEAYLDHWAADLKVEDLLVRSRRESA